MPSRCPSLPWQDPTRIKKFRKPIVTSGARKKFNELQTVANDEVLNMPSSANLYNSNQFDIDSFIQNTYILFIQSFTEEITEAFEQLEFWLSLFIIFNPRRLRRDAGDFTGYDVPELDKLSQWC